MGLVDDYPEFETTEQSRAEFHSVVTIELCELIEVGLFDWERDEALKWDAYDDAQYERLCKKIVARFYHREVSLIPVGFWRKEYVRKMNEIMPKYKLMYKALDDGWSFLRTGDTYGKSRTIGSEFPQTLLSANSDYASNGTDYEFETITDGDNLDKLLDLWKRYKDIDVMILDELESLFSCMWTVNMNVW